MPAARHRTIPLHWADLKEHLRLIGIAINGVMQKGHVNATGVVTLDSGATSTVVARDGITADSVVALSPYSAGASGVAYRISATLGSFTIHHANGIVGADYRYVFFS